MSTKPADLTGPTYWDSWWKSDVPLDDPLREHWVDFGSRGFVLRAIERHVGSLTGRSVAELGGAFSNTLLAMAKWRGVKATAIDYSREGLARTNKMFAHNGCEVELIYSDFFAPELIDRQFDVVTHWGVLEHQPDPLPLIRRSIELTKPGGFVVFSMPQMRGPGAWLWRKLSPKRLGFHIYHSDEAIMRCFEQCGAKVKRAFWGPPFLHMNPCETDNIIARFLATSQFYATQAGKLFPYHFGVPYLSQVRAFVAQVPITPQLHS